MCWFYAALSLSVRFMHVTDSWFEQTDRPVGGPKLIEMLMIVFQEYRFRGQKVKHKDHKPVQNERDRQKSIEICVISSKRITATQL